MKRAVQFLVIVGALTFLNAPASAQMTASKSTTHSSMGGMQAMMPECSAMMKEFMADPIVQKRMMAIMQKHMKQHAGQGSMMMPGTSGGKTMQNTGGNSSSHEAHHSAEPAAMSTAAAPSPTPSP